MRAGARYLLGGVLLLALFMLARAPAALLPSLLPDQAAITLTGAQGLLWSGQGTLGVSHGNASGAFGGYELGRVAWRVAPAALLRGEFGLDLQWLDQGQTLSGELRVGIARYRLEVNGNLDAAGLRVLLEPYHIWIGGDLDFHRVTLSAAHTDALPSSVLTGHIDWSGGDVRYRLTGRDHDTRAPPLQARLGPGFAASLHETTPTELEILSGRVAADGFVSLALTRRFIQLFGLEWPGTGAPTDVVMTLEEQLF
ncbi:MAG: type II secretion system protein N [Pseudomonadales bacterium]